MRIRVMVSAALLAVGLGMSERAHGDGAAQSGDEPRIGIVVTATATLDRAAAVALGEQLGRALQRQLRVAVVAGDPVDRHLGRVVPETCLSQAPCIRDVAARLAVRELLFLTVLSLGDETQINVNWADGESARVAALGSITMAAGDEPEQVFRAIDGQRILPSAAARSPIAPVLSKDGNAASAGGDSDGADDRDDGEDTGAGVLLSSRGVHADEAIDWASPRGRRATTGVYITGGLGALGLLATAGLGIQTLRVQDRECARGCREDSQQWQRVETWRDRTDGVLAVSAVAGLTALLLYAFSGDDDSDRLETAVEMDIYPTVGSLGVQMSGRF